MDFGKDIMLFSGDIILTLTSVDNVGNTREQVYGAEKFTLSAEAFRTADQSTNVCIKGDAATLHVLSYGFPDRIVVEFPKELQTGNEDVKKEFYYPNPDFGEEENIHFNIPLYCPATSYTFMVYAYKDDRQLLAKPVIIVTEESILDSVRVRIR